MTEPWEHIVAIICTALVMAAILGLLGFHIIYSWWESRRDR